MPSQSRAARGSLSLAASSSCCCRGGGLRHTRRDYRSLKAVLVRWWGLIPSPSTCRAARHSLLGIRGEWHHTRSRPELPVELISIHEWGWRRRGRLEHSTEALPLRAQGVRLYSAQVIPPLSIQPAAWQPSVRSSCPTATRGRSTGATAPPKAARAFPHARRSARASSRRRPGDWRRRECKSEIQIIHAEAEEGTHPTPALAMASSSCSGSRGGGLALLPHFTAVYLR
mmetsp:Transcript_4226/g.11917  ORF Transcript_4226/g.11917 Transcript_4226/m.11917 type:complete len:228 (-) Transcript_4226:482-1165(-)